jgi:hypothetical protein
MDDFQLKTPAGDCFSGEPALDEVHHNLLLFISVAPIDRLHGNLAYTEICAQSSRNFLPTVSHILIDAADLDTIDAKGLLPSIITHEMAHALGFNSGAFGEKSLIHGTADDPYFSGGSASSEFVRRITYSGTPVPLENTDQTGLHSSHWRWDIFGDELMIGSLVDGYTYPLSAVTLGAFEDLGYSVDMSVADPYPIYSILAGPPTGLRVSLENDVIVRTPRVLTPLKHVY